MPVRLAMWSGPRNLSTAMMRSFGARPDCQVWDEPFYAAYLKATGSPHPMAGEIINAYETNPAHIAKQCVEGGTKPVFYQKHMTHHMIDGFPLDWLKDVINVFLIRHPGKVIASYHAKREQPNLDDLGFAQQLRIFDKVKAQTGKTPLVIDADDILANPKILLSELCSHIGIGFDPAMLSWPPGPQKEDGIWGKHWYGSVWKSAGFAPPVQGQETVLEGALDHLAKAAEPYYAQLAKCRIHCLR